MLEEDVAVLVGTAHHRALGVQSAFAERFHCVEIEHLRQVFVIPDINFLDLVGSTESVEEVDERNPAFDRRQMCDRAQIHDLLRIGLSQHRKTGLTAGINVRMVAEDVQCMGRNRSRRNVEHAGQQLAGDLVHIRDHQQQALGSGVGGGQRASGQRAVDGARSTRLGLHLDDLYLGAEDVLLALCRPLVDIVRHRAGRCNRVDTRYFGKRIADMRCRSITVHGFLFPYDCHVCISSLLKIVTNWKLVMETRPLTVTSRERIHLL